MHMVVEQTCRHPMRMKYDPETKRFFETKYRSLLYERGVMYPYGWIKESGTPPLPHRDCILVTGNKEGFLPGDEAEIKVIGVYRRADGDHKYVVVESHRPVEDIGELSEDELSELLRLYPNISEGEGWFGKETAENCMLHDEKAL